MKKPIGRSTIVIGCIAIIGIAALAYIGKATSPEQRGKMATTELPVHSIARKQSLAPKNGKAIEIHVNNADLTRDQCLSLIKHYRDDAGPEGQVSVHKPSSLLKGQLAPWCVDNIEEPVFFNDNLFK